MVFVSIPFKRESVSKGRKSLTNLPPDTFQFPSNGKAYPKQSELSKYEYGFSRFNSLQTGKRIQSHPHPLDRWGTERFQFPSNGKAYPKILRHWRKMMSYVCFNSLQTGKRIQRSWFRPPCGDRSAWVSIPFKRESVSKDYWIARSSFWAMKFQFPSNGKAYPKSALRSGCIVGVIVFQFPSNGKAYPKEGGVHHQSRSHQTDRFQFPSNGKAYPKNFTHRMRNILSW